MTGSFVWKTSVLNVEFVISENGTVSINSIQPSSRASLATPPADASILPIHQIRLQGEGNYNGSKTSKALVSTYISQRLAHISHREWRDEKSRSNHLEINTKDSSSGLSATSHFTIFDDIPVLRSSTTLANTTSSSVRATSVPSLVVGGLTRSSPDAWWHDFTLSTPNNSWFREAQWRTHTLSDVGIDRCLPGACPASFATYSCSNHGTFSTGTHLPMGMLQNEKKNDTWLWQVENNGSWKWEVGDSGSHVYVAIGGPTYNDHHWAEELKPGESFSSVPAAICHVDGGTDEAFQALTEYRRRIRRAHQDNVNLPLIFNDYMNCLMGDPTEEKVAQLIEPAKKAGAEYFIIDAGWYSDDRSWWEDIGAWEPSPRRFPSGFDVLLAKIKDAGLIPGLWVEPESMGAKAKMAKEMPNEAFFQQNGQRVMERNRYQLDFRHEATRRHLDSVVERLVTKLGVGYFKFDYNIEIIQGTDVNTPSPGAAQLAHNRAYLTWVTSLLDCYPGLVIENCSSGAQRMDYAMLSVHPLQSTSDQEDPVMYAAIAAAVFTAVAPEQSATWAYPQREWEDEINALTVVNSMLGRVHLSGRLDALLPHQFELVCEGMRVYESIRQYVRAGKPFWPLGLPKWHDGWLAVGLVCGSVTLLSVWRRGGPTTCSLPLSHLSGHGQVVAKLLYPTAFAASTHWDGAIGALQVQLPSAVCARVFQLEAR